MGSRRGDKQQKITTDGCAAHTLPLSPRSRVLPRYIYIYIYACVYLLFCFMTTFRVAVLTQRLHPPSKPHRLFPALCRSGAALPHWESVCGSRKEPNHVRETR